MIRTSTVRHRREAFRNELIGPTLAHAATQSRFYQEHLGPAAFKVKTESDLLSIPTVTKRILRSQPLDRLLTSAETPHVVQHTSGTTDVPFRVFRGRAEVEFIRQFFDGQFDPFGANGVRLLSLQPSYHGEGIPIPVATRYSSVNVMDEASGEQDIDQLLRESSSAVSGPVVITGLFHHVRYLTAKLLQRGCDLARLRVAGLFVTGQHVSARWKRILEETWGVRVVPRFSMTEGFGGAIYCEFCRSYHFDHFVVPEILAPFSDEPVVSGIGILHLTSLYPFVQLMPFIRYRTNDIVEILSTPCSERFGLSVRLLGRWDHAAILENRRGHYRVITPSPIFELLENFPVINTGDPYGNINGTVLVGVGNPCFRLEVEQSRPFRLLIKIELRVLPWLFSEVCDQIRAVVLEGLARELPWLPSELGEDSLQVEVRFFPPGSLGAFEPGAIPEHSSDEAG